MDASGDFKDDAGPPTGLNGTEDETERTTESARPAEIESNARRPAESDITKVPSRELDGMNKVESKGGLSVDSAEDPLAEFTFPDGGVLAWTSVFCQFAVHFFVLGISTSVGLFTDYFVSNAVFPGAANTLLSFASTLTTTGIDLYGPLTGLLAEKFSYRLVACTGAILVCSGGLINSFAVSAWTLFVGGLVTGLGYSCMLAPALAIPTHYFRRRLSLAFGLGMSGSGIGGAVIIPTTAALISSLSWRWAYRIIAIVSGVICFVAGLLMRTRLPKRKSHPLLDTAMFRNKTYWKLALSVFFFAPVFLCPFLYIPQQIQDLGGEGGAISGALCLALLNVFTAIGQVAAGLAMKRVGQYNLMVITSGC